MQEFNDMYKILLSVVSGILFFSCSGITHFYNREGWSFSFTQEQFRERLIVAETEAVKEKVFPEFPITIKPKGKAAVKVLVDPDGAVVAVMMDKTIENIKGFNRKLINAARNCQYAKLKDSINRPTYYVTVLNYVFR